jgi:serine/threonine protein kinase
MSPEQIDSPKHVDDRADIYSFGICLYELLSGTVPFNGDTLSELVTRIVQGTPLDDCRCSESRRSGAAQSRCTRSMRNPDPPHNLYP